MVRHISGRPSTPEECWARLMRYAGHWALLGFGYWAITDRQSGRFLGEAGFADFGRDMEPSIRGLPEHGWMLDPAVHGRGLAREALTATLDWISATMGTGRTVAIIAAENAVSRHLAERLGYVACGDAAYRGESVALFERMVRPPA